MYHVYSCWYRDFTERVNRFFLWVFSSQFSKGQWSYLLSFLLSISTNPDAADKNGQTALIVVKQENSISLHNSNPNIQKNDGRTYTFVHRQSGRSHWHSWLPPKANAHPNLQEIEGCTPLYFASLMHLGSHTSRIANIHVIPALINLSLSCHACVDQLRDISQIQLAKVATREWKWERL